MISWIQPLSYLYRGVTDFRNYLYDSNRIQAFKAPHAKVISIGNLTVGGTGKTPLVDFVIKYFVNKNIKVGVVSRAYKASANAPVKVDTQLKNSTHIFGDEPVWLAQENPKASVYCGQSKWQISKWAQENFNDQILVLDDGFQHRKMHRDLNILVLDATESFDKYAVLPKGRARESFEGIKRADVVVITKANLASTEDLDALKKMIPTDKVVVESLTQIKAFRNFHTGAFLSVGEMQKKSAMLFCSVARPDVFERSMNAIFSKTEILAYSDHQHFHADDIESIINKKNQNNLDIFVCTNKDAVKLTHVWPNNQELWVAQQELAFSAGQDELYALFDRLLS